jgi:hypothetical protein
MSRFAPVAAILLIAAPLAVSVFAVPALAVPVSPVGQPQQSSSQTTAAPSQAPSSSTPAGASTPASAQAAKHSVTVTFDYDFRRTPACSDTVKKNCIALFNVYDVSGGAKNRFKLFTIPVPAGATKLVNGITGKSPELVFEPGKHRLAVTAQLDSGRESITNAATVWVVVPGAAADAPSSSAPSKN